VLRESWSTAVGLRNGRTGRDLIPPDPTVRAPQIYPDPPPPSLAELIGKIVTAELEELIGGQGV